MRKYMIILHPDAEQGGYWVTVPSLPGVFTQGETMDQAIEMAKEAITLHIEAMIAHGEPLPDEDDDALAIPVKVAA